MKKFNFLFLLSFLFFCIACDPCKDINCGSNGTCVEGVCKCDNGASGTNCEILTRDEYIDNWDADSQSCSGGSVTGISKLLITKGERQHT